MKSNHKSMNNLGSRKYEVRAGTVVRVVVDHKFELYEVEETLTFDEFIRVDWPYMIFEDRGHSMAVHVEDVIPVQITSPSPR